MNGRTADEAKSTSISDQAFTSALERATSLRPISQRVSESDKSADSGGTGQDRTEFTELLGAESSWERRTYAQHCL
jgi:hypothetical protein